MGPPRVTGYRGQVAIPHSDGVSGVRSGRPQASMRDSHGIFCRNRRVVGTEQCVWWTGPERSSARRRWRAAALIALFDDTGFEFTRIGLEADPLSQWLHAGLTAAGLP